MNDSEEDMFELEAEREIEDELDEITHPFDPTKVRVDPKPITIDALCSRISHNEINLSPKYQRFDDIWTEEAQSRLIESLLIRIPLPAFYVDASEDNYWQVIDGLQRMTTLKKYIVQKDMKLKKLEFLKELEGAGFNDLHRQFQRRILETQITLYAIQPGTPRDVKFNIFKRVNTGGRPLTAQEIRHAIYQGRATELLESISKSRGYRTSPAALKETRMEDRELILRYFTYLRLDPENLKAESLDKRLNDTMHEWLNKFDESGIEKLRSVFFKSLNCLIEIFGDFAFRRPGSHSKKRHPPINKPLFEAWMVNIASLDDGQCELLISKSDEMNQKFNELVSNDSFMSSIYQGTGRPSNVKIRFSTIKHLINEVME